MKQILITIFCHQHQIRETDKKLKRVQQALSTPSNSTGLINSASSARKYNVSSFKPVRTISSDSSSVNSNVDLSTPRKPQQMQIPYSASALPSSKSVAATLDLATPVTIRESRRVSIIFLYFLHWLLHQFN